MKAGAAWLASGVETLREALRSTPQGQRWDCDVLVIGSGYGGAVAAARLAGRPAQGGRPAEVFVIERGREWLPGMFPSRFADLPGQVRFSLQDGGEPQGVRLGLFDVRLGAEVGVLVGNGLGGGSLINAAVMEEPEKDPKQRAWKHVASKEAARTAAYDKAKAMLQSAGNRVPGGDAEWVPLAKLRALDRLAAIYPGAGDRARRVQLAVNFKDTSTPPGVPRQPCIGCGDCVTGCNWQAKNSLDANYLAHAYRHGARLFTGTLALRIEPAPSADDGWWVRCLPTELPAGTTAEDARVHLTIRARRVVVAAGTLGSTELLLRSQSGALRFSPRLGERFSGNGDSILAAVGQSEPTGINADEEQAFDQRHVGPTITGMVRFDNEGFVAQEFAVPAPLRRVLAEVTGSFGLLHRLVEGDASEHRQGKPQEDPLAAGPQALSHTMLYGVQGDDGAAGRLRLRPANKPWWDGTVAIEGSAGAAQPPLRKAEVYARQHKTLKKWHDKDPETFGIVVPNPTWRPLPAVLAKVLGMDDGPLFTVHPLGGCAIGGDAEDGVVNGRGEVYAPALGPKEVHIGLAVLDGSIVPGALGINPALTIAALAEHAVEGLAKAWDLGPQPAAARTLPPHHAWSTPLVQHARPTATRLEELLTGPLEISGARYWAELRMRFAVDDLLTFVNRHPHAMKPGQGVLKLYPARSREDEPQFAPVVVRPPPLHEVEFTAELTVMDIESSTQKQRIDRAEAWWDGVLKGQSTLSTNDRARIAGMIGEVRTLHYRLTIPKKQGPFEGGDRLLGSKQVEGAPGTTLWRQLSVLQIQLQRGGQRLPCGELEVDLGDFAGRSAPVLQVTDQEDATAALLHGGAMLALFLRALLKLHLPNIGLVGDQDDRSCERMPGDLPGLTRRYDTLAAADADYCLGVTRYVGKGGTVAGLPPTVLLHGLGASGSTFAHPSIPNNLVQTLCASGRVVWVVELRTSVAHPKSRLKPWSMEVAAGDLQIVFAHIRGENPALFDTTRADVIAHCIGSAMFCLAALKSDALARFVRRAVLSQVAPIVRLSPMNRLRGFVASYIKQFLGTPSLDTRPTATDLRQKLIDIVINSFPYPADDDELQRLRRFQDHFVQHPPEAAPCDKPAQKEPPDFRRVRHRADAIFGQLFQLGNVGNDTLAALDALIGYVSVETLAQTIQFARWNLLADSSGHNESVTHTKIGEGMDFPVMFFHGRENRVFEWRGSRQALELFRSIFKGVPGSDEVVDGVLHLGQGSARQLLVLSGYGHQDPFIGERAHAEVFPRLLAFLDATIDQATGTKDKPLALTAPWVGPALGDVRWTAPEGQPGAGLTLKLQVHPRPSRQTTIAALIAARDAAGGWRLLYTAYSVDKPGEDIALALRQQALTLPVDSGGAIDSAETHHETLHAFLVHDDLPGTLAAQTWTERILVKPPRIAVVKDLPPALEAYRPGLLAELDRMSQSLSQRELRDSEFRFEAHVKGGADRTAGGPPADAICFAVASCQYPPGLIDEEVAGRSYQRLLDRLKEGTEPRPQWLLLLGDQIYADPTAGVFDPAPDNAWLDRAYELNRRLCAQRRVYARLPVVQLLDDHEVRNDWQPAQGGDPAARNALELYQQWQACLNPPPVAQGRSHQMAPGGWPLFLLDTRSRREQRGPSGKPVQQAALVSPQDLKALRAWLQQAPGDAVKFVATSVALLPIDRYVAGLGLQERLASDSASGYPGALFELLQILGTADNVVLLAGDAHLSLACTLTLHGNGRAIHAVVSSALYAPWPFANQYGPEDLVLDGEIELSDGAGGSIRGRMTRHAIERRNGFAIVHARRAAGRPAVTVELHNADSGTVQTVQLQ